MQVGHDVRVAGAPAAYGLAWGAADWSADEEHEVDIAGRDLAVHGVVARFVALARRQGHGALRVLRSVGSGAVRVRPTGLRWPPASKR